jgi:hypothetical protein
MQAQRKNMERMEEVVVEADAQRFQQSPWDHRAILNQVAMVALFYDL